MTNYANMKFPDYEFQEYPKHVPTEGGKGFVVVNDEAEEKALSEGETIIREPEERARLIKVAEIKGVTIDKRWSLDRIRSAISGAGYDPELNPDA